MKKLILMMVLVFFISGASASYIYGDIYLDENGVASFAVDTDVDLDLEGISFSEDHLSGETNELISLERGVWSFLLNGDYYDTILIDIHLPGDVDKVISVEGVNFLMGFSQKTINIIDHDKILDFEITYELESSSGRGFVYFLMGIILIGVVVLYVVKSKKKKKFEDIFPLINDVEKKIIEMLMKKSMRQKEIRKHLDIPKASYSRYLVNLEKKKLIIREGEGKNKIIKLK